MKVSRLAVALAAVPLLFVGACSQAADSGTDTEDSAAPSTVTFTDRFGETTLDAIPERVVTLSVSDNDAALAAGVVPVAMTASVVKPVMPWTENAITELGGTVPPLLEFTDVPVEEVASYEPDLILATGIELEEPVYRQLSAVAPTLARADENKADSWTQQTQRVAELFGVRDDVDRQIAEVETALAEAADRHPELDGATYAVSLLHSTDQAGLLTGPESATSQLFGSLGLVPSPTTEEFVTEGKSNQISPENLDVLEADVLVGYFPDDSVRESYYAMPVFASLEVVKNGRHYAPTDEEWRAFRSTSLLSMSWLGEQLPEKIAAAVRGEA